MNISQISARNMLLRPFFTRAWEKERAMSEPKEFKLSDVVVIKKNNNCLDCETRVKTYLQNVAEWQSTYDAIKSENEQLKQIINEPGSKGRMYLLMKAERDAWKSQAEKLASALDAYSDGKNTPVSTEALTEFNEFKRKQ